MTGCDSYILRIYRRDAEHPDKVVGLIEIVGRDEKKKFTDAMQLWRILCSRKSRKDVRTTAAKEKMPRHPSARRKTVK